jgi:hypothetical protein
MLSGNMLLLALFLQALVLLFGGGVNGQQTNETSSCVTDPGLQPVIQLDQKVTTLFISMPAFWCEGSLPNDFVFTIEPRTNSSSSSSSTSSLIYTLPTMYSPLLQANQTTDGTTTVTILAANTSYSASTGGAFGVVIQVPANDLQTVLLERSFYFDQNSINLRIAPGFTALTRIACQTLAPYDDAQGIEMDADISSSTSPVTLDLLHHGTYHVIGNVSVLNVGHQAALSSSADQTHTGVQIRGNVISGSITRPGLYTVSGNITGSLTINSTTTTSSTSSVNNDTSQEAKKGARLTTTSSCDNVTVVGSADACNTVTAGTLANMMVSSLFFTLNCTVIACTSFFHVMMSPRPSFSLSLLLHLIPLLFSSLSLSLSLSLVAGQETGVPNAADSNTCLLSTKCPLFGQPEVVPNTPPTPMPTPAPTHGTSGAAAAAADGRLLDLVAVAVLCWTWVVV